MEFFLADVVADSVSDLGEGALWDYRSGRVYWVDVFAKQVKWLEPLTGQIGSKTFPAIITYIGLAANGGFILAAGDALYLASESLDLLSKVPLAFENLSVRSNDGNIDSQGRLWIGSMAYDATPNQGVVQCFDSRLQGEVRIQPTTISNGIDWDPSNSILYFVDSPTRQVTRYSFDQETGELIAPLSPIDVSDVPGVPDGMCVDAEGNLWVAFWGGSQVRNYSPTGKLIKAVNVPTSLVTCCAFGGQDLSTLYITTAKTSHDSSILAEEPLAGSLFIFATQTRGRTANMFQSVGSVRL